MKKTSIIHCITLAIAIFALFLFAHPVSVFAAAGPEPGILMTPEEIRTELRGETVIENKTCSVEELRELLEIFESLSEVNPEMSELINETAQYRQLLMLAEMAAAHESSVNFARKDLPLTNPVYEAGAIRWEAPADSDTVYLVYTAYGYNDFQSTDVKVQESLLLPEYKDGCWSCDFHKVTDSIGTLNVGVLGYQVISIDCADPAFDLSYSGSANVHVIMNPAYITKDANGEIKENGGTIDLDHYMYFDGDPVNVLVEENEGFKLTLLAHKKGSSENFTLDSSDDLIYFITGEFTKMRTVTLNAGGASEASTVMSRFERKAPWDPMAEYDGGSLVTFYVPYGMATETFINQYLAPTTVDFLGSTRYIGLGAQPLDAYNSDKEVADSIANLPKTVTADMSCCLLWARPIASVDISVNMPAIGTKITSRTAADGTVTQSITPVCTISGDAAFDAGANTSWVDASLQAFNGTVGKDTCYLGSAITPKFGYYFADSSYTAIRVNGRTVTAVLPIFNKIIILQDVATQ